MGKYEELKNAFLPAEVVEPDTPSMESLGGKGGKPPLNRSKAIADIKNGNDWHNNCVRLVASLVAEGRTDEEILALAPELTLTGFTVDETIAELQSMIDGARAKGFGPEPPSYKDWPTPFDSFDELLIQPRRWLYGTTYLRGYVTLLAAPGGVGKTSLQIVEALAIVTGRPLLGEEVNERANVWLINLEDSIMELIRRVLAAMRYYNIPADEIRGRLFLDADRDMSFQFVSDDGGKVAMNHVLVARMIRKIKENEIGLIILDPFVSCFNVNENDNRAINMVVSALKKIADETNAAIAIVHHTRKLNGDETSIDGVRGASSLIGAIRVGRVVNRISKQDAQAHCIDESEAKSIFRVDIGKLNFAPPAEETFWYKLENVQLLNGEFVGVARRFDINSAIPDVNEELLTGLRAKLISHESDLKASEKATDWIGNAVANALDLDIGQGMKAAERSPEQARNRGLVKIYIQQMYDLGWLMEISKHDSRNGREAKFVHFLRDLD